MIQKPYTIDDIAPPTRETISIDSDEERQVDSFHASKCSSMYYGETGSDVEMSEPKRVGY